MTQVRQLGPGRYETKDFIETTRLKHCSNRGICDARAPRFPPGNKVHIRISVSINTRIYCSETCENVLYIEVSC